MISEDKKLLGSFTSMAGASQSLLKPQKLLLDSDVAAAQKLMQLSESDEDNKTERSKEESIWAMIEVIFGKEDQEEMEKYQPKKRRYRSLDSLYRATKPVPFEMYRKKLRYY